MRSTYFVLKNSPNERTVSAKDFVKTFSLVLSDISFLAIISNCILFSISHAFTFIIKLASPRR